MHETAQLEYDLAIDTWRRRLADAERYRRMAAEAEAEVAGAWALAEAIRKAHPRVKAAA